MSRKSNKIVSANCLFPNQFFSESDFSTMTSYFFNPTSKMLCDFSLELNMANRGYFFFFRSLGSRSEEQITTDSAQSSSKKGKNYLLTALLVAR